jgi:hypothetical protein
LPELVSDSFFANREVAEQTEGGAFFPNLGGVPHQVGKKRASFGLRAAYR